MQSIGGGDDWFVPWMALTQPIHEQYAAACDADYLLFAGNMDRRVHPAWNRIAMFLEAFDRGYDKVCWLDADTLVVDQTVNIFEACDDTPLHMTRAVDVHVEMPWGEDGWDLYNDGVLVANDCEQARRAFSYVWRQRLEPLLPHHHASLWEMNAVTDWVFSHRESVADLPMRFNWMPFDYAPPKTEAVVLAYHGIPREERWQMFLDDYEFVYGPVAA